MRNPLYKRIPRNFIGDIGKYFVIAVFMILTIGLVSGFLVAGDSMIVSYNESFEKYNIENGHFVVSNELTEASIKEMEKEKIHIYKDFYREMDVDKNGDGKRDSTIRMFVNRTKVNKVCLMKGKLPKGEKEIAIDRMYADNNKLTVGDTIEVGGKKLKISGLVALSDYSALFSDNADLMFDSIKFGVAVVEQQCFDQYTDTKVNYDYAWKYEKEPKNETKEKEVAEDLLEKIVGIVATQQVSVQTYIPGYANQAIHFTGDDIGGDRTMIIVLLYVVIVILGFVFSVTINHTITKEAAVIGTLRASGYTRGELKRHYMCMPILITLIAALIGNILGYSFFKDMVAGLYYNSYSLPTYKTLWNADAFVLTTVVPILLMILTNYYFITKSLRLSPLKFIRRDLSKTKKQKARKLPNFSFLSRFRLRIVLQNMSSYVVLFVGILFANVLLLFGLMMSPLLTHYQHEIVDKMVADYQYVLKTPVETENEKAEKFSITTLKTEREPKEGEEISIYGIKKDSDYLKIGDSEDGVYISKGFSEKYQYKKGDIIRLKEPYENKYYKFKIKGMIDYPASLAVFMDQKQFAKMFDKEEDYFNGYFTNEKLSDVKDNDILNCITQEDLTKVSRQMEKSMGSMFYIVEMFAVVLAAMLIYLLTKLIIEKNSNSISMVKILGYTQREIGGLYLTATTWVVIISVLISLGISTVIMRKLFFIFMQDYGGWLSCYIETKTYVEMFVINLGMYFIVALLQFMKIKKIPMEEALKNVE